jgi:anti-sigma factor RsiW
VELDGELSEFERVLLRGHLAACPACSAFRASVTRVTDELRNTSMEPFRTAITVRRRRRRAFRLAPAAAALAVSAVGLGSILTSAQIKTVPGAAGREEPTSEIESLTNLVRQSQSLERVRQPVRRAHVVNRIPGGPVLRQ